METKTLLTWCISLIGAILWIGGIMLLASGASFGLWTILAGIATCFFALWFYLHNSYNDDWD
jgi:hypothetical protein